MKSVHILDTQIDNYSISETLAFIENAIKNHGRIKLIFTPNVDHLMIMRKDADFKKAYSGADLRVADGMPLVWASLLLGNKLKQRVNGTNLIYDICRISEINQYSIFFMGGEDEIARKAISGLKEKYPDLNIAGYHSPSFNISPEENKQIMNKINDAHPDILLVGLGPPKQEKWLYLNRQNLRACVGIGIGGAFDLISGVKKRAPVWMQNTGLEWFHRLLNEPKRLWRRYLRDLAFPLLVVGQVIKQGFLNRNHS